jgi:putative transposase
MNREQQAVGEHYHVYIRGVDKRNIFSNQHDVQRFFDSLVYFNTRDPVGSLLELGVDRKVVKQPKNKLVQIVAYCLNPNHYHLLLRQGREGGIAEFMKRVNGGYTWYFNKKEGRSGSLLQGTYKSRIVDSNEYLLHLSAYINLNYSVHKFGGLTAKLHRSSWEEYTTDQPGICEKSIVLDQFDSIAEYEGYARNSLPLMLDAKADKKELDSIFHE